MIDTDYTHARKICEDFEIKKKLGECYNWHVQSNTLLLADILNNFWNVFLEIYVLGNVLSAPAMSCYSSKSNNKYMKYFDKNK